MGSKGIHGSEIPILVVTAFDCGISDEQTAIPLPKGLFNVES